MLDYRMKTFLTLCRTFSYTKTAKELSITQPTVTQHIQYLEQLYGVKLFDYRGRKLTLTQKGLFLYHCALRIRADAEKVGSYLSEEKEERTIFQFGATPTIGEFIMPQIMEAITRLDEYYKISLVMDNSDALLEKVRKGEIACAFIEGYFDKSAFAHKLFAKDDFIPVCAPSYQFQNKPQMIEDLLNEPVFLRESGAGTREVLAHYLHGRNLLIRDFKHVTFIGNLNVIKYLVMRGRGIAFLYKASVRREMEEGKLCEIKLREMSVSHEYTYVTLGESIFEEEYDRFFQFAKMNLDEIYR